MKTVIAVDDEKNILDNYQMMFAECEELESFKLETYAHPGLAWKHYHRADLIMFDVNINGACEVKTNLDMVRRKTKAPILVVSGASDLESVLADTCADRWLNKPVDLDTLVNTIVEMTTALAHRLMDV